MGDPAERMLRYFEGDHLPDPLRVVSKPFEAVAVGMVEHLPAGPEKTAAMRKLREAKDCAVRAALDLE